MAALLAPSLAPMVGANLWGWLPDHGHASAHGVVGAHTHPWDLDTSRAASAPGHAPLADVGFTAGDLLGAPALPVHRAVLIVIPPLLPALVGIPRTVGVDASPLVPEPPPPR